MSHASNATKSPVATNITEERVCYYCKKPGHFISDCFVLKRKQENQEKEKASKPVGVIAPIKPIEKAIKSVFFSSLSFSNEW